MEAHVRQGEESQSETPSQYFTSPCYNISLFVSIHIQFPHMDFAVGILDLEFATLVNRALSPLDISLFLRPLTGRVWAALAAFLLLSAAAMAATVGALQSSRGGGGGGESASGRAVAISGKIRTTHFFVVIGDYMDINIQIVEKLLLLLLLRSMPISSMLLEH